MAVVELGWTIRTGYAGDIICKRQLPSLMLQGETVDGNFASLLTAADALETGEVQPMWTFDSVMHHMDRHVEHLAHIMGRELHCACDETLVLVVPEMWHERFDFMRQLFVAVLESSCASALYCFRPSIAWTFSSGKTTGVVLDVGHNHATAAAVVDGYVLRDTVATSTTAGGAVTRSLQDMIGLARLLSLERVNRYRKPEVQAWAMHDLVGDIKRLSCFVGSGGSGISAGAGSHELRAPDGSSLTVEALHRTAPYEVLFSTSQRDSVSLPDLLVSCVGRLDPEWRQQSVTHILCGGTSRASGFRERLLKEVQLRDSCYFRYEREGALKAKSSIDGAWVGASLATDNSSFASLWVTRADMEEEGDSVLYRKLFY
ncbi:putative Actin [Trypanosoma vivax]|uniref:Putative actin n=1 Tax=Trypanosoma vivax (strain Y486) TaxID=1055687 RepID=G0TTX3_TRYVY|nr:putative actin [Trypanosoma vivax]KAH8614170.1 putative Actin [Trypanosoma vivax]CCC47406.1 putative actin [Trypanosoma vivax Y486]